MSMISKPMQIDNTNYEHAMFLVGKRFKLFECFCKLLDFLKRVNEFFD